VETRRSSRLMARPSDANGFTTSCEGAELTGSPPQAISASFGFLKEHIPGFRAGPTFSTSRPQIGIRETRENSLPTATRGARTFSAHVAFDDAIGRQTVGLSKRHLEGGRHVGAGSKGRGLPPDTVRLPRAWRGWRTSSSSEGAGPSRPKHKGRCVSRGPWFRHG